MSAIIQVDDFATDAMEVRDAVIAGGFSTETGPDSAKYTGISRIQVPSWYRLIEKTHRDTCRILPRLSCFRLNLAGELPHSWVHSDDICAKYASVLYLNLPEQCQGGTAFWKHDALGMDRLLSDAEMVQRGMDVQAFHRFMTREWKDLTFWKQVDFVTMKFNRFITYRTSLFHSRYPFEAFGQGPEDGRLIWICFYDIEGEQ